MLFSIEDQSDIDSNPISTLPQVSSPRPSHTSGLDSMFRPFNMHGMDNVSILFADIVGFTRMSSNKVCIYYYFEFAVC